MTSRVLITGASAGLGEGMARLFASRGADLAIAARRLDQLEALRDELESRYPGQKVVPVRMDITDSESVFAAFDHAESALGGLDRLVINAGLGKGSRLGAGRFDANRDTAITNFVGGIAQCEAAMRVLYRQEHGQLVVMASVVAVRGMAGPMNVYAASKAALVRLAEGIRSDVQAKGLPIKVTTLRPGYIDSEMQARAGRQHRLMIDSERGCRVLVDAIEREAKDVCVPRWPWAPFSAGLRYLPSSMVRRIV
ncbi:SDR family oxidoreductase [Sciscionella marina]|uniref:SDR family oxidoreductase n=1 Tax=Sciscionella marina TaxID=508770 RepID=UPI000363DB74|nr:SDR family oxidoreductase [Sciscionella marina]